MKVNLVSTCRDKSLVNSSFSNMFILLVVVLLSFSFLNYGSCEVNKVNNRVPCNPLTIIDKIGHGNIEVSGLKIKKLSIYFANNSNFIIS